MDLVLSIFQRLDIDKTIFAQFAITVVLFFLLDRLLFRKIFFVLKYRDGKTTLLEEEANKKIAKADELAASYKDKLDSAFNEAQENLKKRKAEITRANRSELDRATGEIAEATEARRKSYASEINGKRESVLSASDELSNDLVNKLVQ
jgi:F0F1-type ATP synthase membrane subunit b/b'